MYKVIISWIQGAILPIVSLGMTALIADNIKLFRSYKNGEKEITNKEEVKKEEVKNVIIEDFEPIQVRDQVVNQITYETI